MNCIGCRSVSGGKKDRAAREREGRTCVNRFSRPSSAFALDDETFVRRVLTVLTISSVSRVSQRAGSVRTYECERFADRRNEKRRVNFENVAAQQSNEVRFSIARHGRD